MVFAASFDPTLQIVLLATLVTVLLTLGLLVRVIWLRVRNIRTDQRRDRVADAWRPLFAQVMVGQEPVLPPLRGDDQFYFFSLWNHYYLSVKGEARQHLVRMAERLNLPEQLPALLKHGSEHRRLEAIQLLGRMHAEGGWDELLRIAQTSDKILSLSALRALMEIDPMRAAEILLPAMLDRRGWSEIVIANVLIETSNEAVTTLLSQRLTEATPPQQARLLYWLEVTRSRTCLPHIRQLLIDPANDEITLRCLRLAGRLADHDCLPLVRTYFRHPRPGVRQCVANYLARCGTREDVPLLLEMTGDTRWTVRHAAARALLSLPFMKDVDLIEAQRQLDDRYARDMLSQAFAETKRGKTA